MKKLVVLVLALLLVCPPALVSADAPTPTLLPPDHAQDGTANNSTNATLGAVISPRASLTSYGHDEASWGDLTQLSTNTGVWAKTIGKDGNIELRWNDNGTVHKILMNLVGFKGSTKVANPSKEVNTTETYISKEPVYNTLNKSKVDYYKNITKFKTSKVPSELSTFGYIGTVPVTVKWQAYPLQMKETVIWNSTTLTSAQYLIKIDSKDIKINSTTLGFIKDNKTTGLGLNPPTMMDGKNESMELNWSLTQIKADQWTLDINWTYPVDAVAPYILDPTISFDGTTFTIDDAQWEIKTYQQVDDWAIFLGKGTNKRFLSGYLTLDSDGIVNEISYHRNLGVNVDMTYLSDFTIDVKTTNADASWVLYISFATSSNYGNTQRWYWSKSLANDVDATYTMSDFTQGAAAPTDPTAIRYVLIQFSGADNPLGADVVCQVKDLKFTIPVKTSDLCNEQGLFQLGQDEWAGDDGLDLDEYNPVWECITGPPTTEPSIDDDSFLNGAFTHSVFFPSNSSNSYSYGSYINTPYDISDGLIRIRTWFWAEFDGDIHIAIKATGGVETARIYYSNADFYGYEAGGHHGGQGGYSYSEWYEAWMDLNLTDNTVRYWYEDPTTGMMFADNKTTTGGLWDGFNNNVISGINVWTSGQGNVAIGPIIIQTMHEEFSALSSPHEPDDITESDNPTNTDYGRQTWDGCWSDNDVGADTAVNNTDLIIGSNSIKVSTIDNMNSLKWTYDTIQDISSATHLRFYFKSSTINSIRVWVFDSGIGTSYKDISIVAAKWNYIDLSIGGPWSGWNTAGSLTDQTDIHDIGFQNKLADNEDLWIDGLHFYGETNAGVCFQGNSIDLNGADLDQDRAIYDIFEISDTTGTPGTWTAIMDNATHNLNMEFSDVASAGFDHTSADEIDSVVIRGYDKENIIVLTSVGDATPSNTWDTDQWYGDKDLQNFRVSYCGKLEGGVQTALTLRNGTISHSAGSGLRFYSYTRPADTIIENVLFDDLGFNIRLQNMASTTPIYFENITVTNIKGGGRVVSSFAASSAMLVFKNSTFDFDENEMGAFPTSFLMVSKNHNKTDGYLIHITGTGLQALSDIPSNDRWGPGADVDVLFGTLELDEAATLTNGSWTKDGGATVNIETGINLTMLNSAYDPADFTIAGTGLLLDRNFTTPGESVSAPIITFYPTNSTTTFSWTPIWLYTDSGGVRTEADWKVTWATEGTNTILTHRFTSYGIKTITVGSWLDPDWTTTVTDITITMPGGGGGISVKVAFHIEQTFNGVRFIPDIPSGKVAINYTWDFGDGSTSTASSPTHYYREAGAYNVSMTVYLQSVGSVTANAFITAPEPSTLQVVLKALELNEKGLLVHIGAGTITLPPMVLLFMGFMLIAVLSTVGGAL